MKKYNSALGRLTIQMRSHGFAACLAAIAIAASSAASFGVPISGLWPTGQNNLGFTILLPGIPDPHYTLIAPPNLNDVTVNDTAYPFPPWVPNTYGLGGSRWIGPAANSYGPAGTYRYVTQFSLPNNAILSTAMIAGLWGTDDNSLDIWLNGNPQGQVSAGFTSLVPFMVTSGFQVGLNTLEFRLNNAGGPTGLRVARIGGKYLIPEPVTAGIGAIGCFAALAYRRRRMT